MKIAFLVTLFTAIEAKKKCGSKNQLPKSAYDGIIDGPNGEHLGGKTKAKPADMEYVPVPRSDYVPKQTIKCAYQHIVPETQKVVTAQMTIDTKRPTLNLDNFVQIKTVDCVKDLIHLQFDTPESAKKAYAAWSITKDLVMMLGHQHKCKDVPQTATMQVEKILEPQGTSLTIDTVGVDAKDVITEYELDIAQFENTGTAKRGLFDFLTKTHSKTLNYPFSINYDRAQQKVARPEITLLDTKLGKASCNNCFTNGDASIGLHIKATLFVVREYKVHLFGDFKANLDIALDVYQAQGMVLPPITLWSLPLTPVNVPGIFNFGPELLLQTGISFDVPEPIGVTYGFDLGFKFDYGIFSNKGLFSKPQVIKEGVPSINEHQFKATKDIKVKVAGHLIPAITLNLSVLRIAAFDMRLQLDSSLGVDVRTGKFLKCPEDKLNIELFHEHDFTFDIKGPGMNNRLPIYQSGQLPIKCFFCDKCIAPQTSALPLASTTAVSSAAASTTTSVVITSTAVSTTAAPSTTTVSTTAVAQSTTVASTSTASQTTSVAQTSATTSTFATSSTAVTSSSAKPAASTSTAVSSTKAASTSTTTTTSSIVPKPTCGPYDYKCMGIY